MNALLERTTRAVVCVVDATTLQRGLYLALQLIESGVPVVIAAQHDGRGRADGASHRRTATFRTIGRARDPGHRDQTTRARGAPQGDRWCTRGRAAEGSGGRLSIGS